MNNIETKKMRVLSLEEKVTSKTFCRPLIIREGGSFCQYSGSPCNHALFVECERVIPALIGMTVKEINKSLFNLHRGSPYIFFVNVPDYLVEPLTESEFSESNYSCSYLEYSISRENALWAGLCGLDEVDWHNSNINI